MKMVEVLGFEFVKSTAFSNIEHLLKECKENVDTNVEIIMLDNCCSWRKKVTSLFKNTDVKLDLFHAVQRITKYIHMYYDYRTNILKDLRLVFRQVHDVEKERKFTKQNGYHKKF